VINQELAYVSAVGTLIGIQVAERGEDRRPIIAALNHSASQLVAIGAYG